MKVIESVQKRKMKGNMKFERPTRVCENKRKEVVVVGGGGGRVKCLAGVEPLYFVRK